MGKKRVSFENEGRGREEPSKRSSKESHRPPRDSPALPPRSPLRLQPVVLGRIKLKDVHDLEARNKPCERRKTNTREARSVLPEYIAIHATWGIFF